MADAVKALTGWRQRRDTIRAEHTHTVVQEALPARAQAVLIKMADELDLARKEREADRARIRRLEAVIARLAITALDGP